MCALGDCLQPELFLQEVGVLHFFAAGLCLPGSCGETVGAIAAIYPMLLQVFCPGAVKRPYPEGVDGEPFRVLTNQYKA